MSEFEKFVVRMLFILAAAWAVMLGIGVVHAEVLPDVNAVGYGTSMTLTAVVFLVGLFYSLWDDEDLR